MLIERVTSLEKYNLNFLLDESMTEGYKFVRKLCLEYTIGSRSRKTFICFT